MDNLIFSKKSNVPVWLISCFFRSITEISSINVYGHNSDYEIEFIFLGKSYHVDRQFGDVQIFHGDGSYSDFDIKQMKSLGSRIPTKPIAWIFFLVSYALKGKQSIRNQ